MYNSQFICFYSQADMMRLEATLPYFQNDLFQMLVLHYKEEEGVTGTPNRNTRMVVILPHERYVLSATLAALNGSALLKSIGLTEFRYVEVRTFFASSDIHNFLLGIFTDSIKPLLNTFHSIKFHIFNDDFYEIYG